MTNLFLCVVLGYFVCYSPVHHSLYTRLPLPSTVSYIWNYRLFLNSPFMRRSFSVCTPTDLRKDISTAKNVPLSLLAIVCASLPCSTTMTQRNLSRVSGFVCPFNDFFQLVESEGSWRWPNIQHCWASGLRPSCRILNTRKQNVSETGCFIFTLYCVCNWPCSCWLGT
jgi:hypothetical protein